MKRAATITLSIALIGFAVGAAPDDARLRRPVAAAVLGRLVAVANQRSGTVSLVDPERGAVVRESAVGKHLTDLAALADGRLLVTDDEAHELIVARSDGDRLSVVTRLPVARYPASVVVQPGGRTASVASLWSRRVSVIDLTSPRVRHTIPLPFAPRLQCVLPGSSRVVVADAFGGQLAVIDAAAGRLEAVQTLDGHNVRGLGVSDDGRELLITHQTLDQKLPTTHENIARGVLIANVLRAVPVDALLKNGTPLTGRIIRWGTPGNGAGDPAGVVALGAGRVAVALSGVHEVALADGENVRRVAVGRRPTALLLAAGGLVAVNTFGDSLSVLDPATGAVLRTISLGKQPEPTYADRGELLFYDARLARDGWLSCASCHPGGHTNGLLADTLGDGTYGTPKRTLTLLNTRLTDPWGWTGQFRSLQDQVKASVEQTLHSPHGGWKEADDITSFLVTLPPPPPLLPDVGDDADRARLERGRKVFERRRCGTCHVGPQTYTSWEVFDVGFTDERGHRTFNPPSLRGVGHGASFLHDGRARTLEEVFRKHGHQVGPNTTDEDVADLVRFLRSL